MTTKFNIGESVCLYDFNDEKVVFGTIMGIQAFASKQCHTELSDVFMQVEIIYDVDCVGYKYDRAINHLFRSVKEKHLFKSVDECREYYLDHLKI